MEKNSPNLEDYIKEGNVKDDNVQNSSGSVKEIMPHSDENLEKIIEEIIPKQKTFRDYLYDAVTWPVRNYNWILGALLPISAFTLHAITKTPPDWSSFATIPLGVLASQVVGEGMRTRVKKKGKESLSTRIFNWVYDNSMIVGFGLGAAIFYMGINFYMSIKGVKWNEMFAATSGIKYLSDKFPANTELYKSFTECMQASKKANLLVSVSSICGGVIFTILTNVIAMFRPDRVKKWRYVGSQIINYFKPIDEETRLKNSIALCEKAVKEGEENRYFLMELASNNLYLGNFKEGMYAYSKVLEHREGTLFELFSKSFLSQVADILAAHFKKYRARKRGYNLESFEGKIEDAYNQYYSHSNIKSSVRRWDEALAIVPKEYKLEFELLHAMFLEDAEQMELAKEAIGKWLSHVISTSEFEKNLREIPSSRNEVFELTQSEFLKDTIIVKRNKGIDIAGEEKRIYAEYFANIFLSYLFKHRIEHDFKSIVPRSLFTFRHEDGKLYHVMRRTSGRNLEEAFRDAGKERKEEYLREVMKSSALIHAHVIDFLKKDERGYYFLIPQNKKIFRINIEEFNYTDVLKARLIRRLGENAFLERFLKDAEDYSHSFYDLPRVFAHGDAYITNFIEDGSWIDLEKRTIANPMMDIAGILEAPECAETDKSSLLQLYAKEFVKNYQHRKKELKENIIDLYIPNKIFNAFYQIGSKSAQKQPDQAEYFLEKAVIYLQEEKLSSLLNSFVEYIRKTGNEEFISRIREI